MTTTSPTSVPSAVHSVARRPLVAWVGVQAFWSLLALQALVIALAALWLYNSSSPVATPTPLTATSDLALVRESIWARLQGSVNDPMIAVGSQGGVRESNLRGFRLNGTIYYYYVDHADAHNYDPLSRGAVTHDAVEILLRDEGGPYPLVIYTLYGE